MSSGGVRLKQAKLEVAPSSPSIDTSSSKIDEDSKDNKPLFHCKVHSVATVITLLNTLYVDKGITVYVTVMPVSLRFSVSKDKNMRARVYLKLPSFSLYEMKSESARYTFAVNLGVLLQCLQVFGEGLLPQPQAQSASGKSSWQHNSAQPYSSAGMVSSASLEMTYANQGGPLYLKITDKESGAITECNIRTLDISNDDDMNSEALNFKACPVIAKIVLPSNFLRETLAAADSLAGATTLTLAVKPDTSGTTSGDGNSKSSELNSKNENQPLLSVSAQGTGGRISYDLPTTGRGGVFTTFECTSAARITYPLSLIKACSKAMLRSENSMLRVNERGTLALHHMVPPIGLDPATSAQASSGSEDKSNWIEFVVAALDVD